jgi:excisionase family DNA binding protein
MKGTQQLLGIRDVACRLGCSLKYAYDLVWTGGLPGARKSGRIWLIPASAVESRLKAKEGRNGTARR